MIVLDDVHTNPLRSTTVRALAREFVERNITSGDQVALVSTSGRQESILDFTASKRRLLAAIERFQGGYGPFLLDSIDNKQGVQSTLKYLGRLAAWLSEVEGRRRAVVLISEGFSSAFTKDGSVSVDSSVNGPSSAGVSLDTVFSENSTVSVLDGLSAFNGDAADLREVIDGAARGNVRIYAIDPRGLPGGPTTTVKPVPTLVDEGLFSRRQIAEQHALRVLADETGGFALLHSNEFSLAFERVVSENSSYYFLGYTPRDPTTSGFKRIRVRVNRPGLTVRARTGYVTKPARRTRPVPDERPGLTELLKSPANTPGLAMRVSAAAFRTSTSKSSVVVVVEALEGQIPSEVGDRQESSMALLVVAADEKGNVKASERGTLTIGHHC